MSVLCEGDGWRVRLARPDDEPHLRHLMAAIPMGGAVEVAQEREPDFHSLLRLHGGTPATLVVVDDTDASVACGSYVARDGWIDGEIHKVGYACDLRVLPAWRGARVFPDLLAAGMDDARKRHGVDVMHTAVIDGNRRAVAAATHRTPRRRPQPVLRVVTPYRMVSFPFAGRRPPPRGPVRNATPDDMETLARFLDERSRARTFGYKLDRKALETRLATWPGLRLEDFLLAFDSAGNLVGCAAPWEAHPVRQSRAVTYRGWMRTYRGAFNGVARAAGWPTLPAPGGFFRFAYLTHLEVAGEDAGVFRDLLRAAYVNTRHRGLHFLGAMIVRGSPMERAVTGPFGDRMPITLYSAAHAEGAFRDRDFRTSRPGFEMALA